MMLHVPPGVMQATALATVVCGWLGGVRRPEIEDLAAELELVRQAVARAKVRIASSPQPCNHSCMRIQACSGSQAVRIGQLTRGNARHRALLFKYLWDRIQHSTDWQCRVQYPATNHEVKMEVQLKSPDIRLTIDLMTTEMIKQE